jgi:BRO family protein
MEQQTVELAETFSINSFFNGQAVRVVGSPVEPFFYAGDIATILNISEIDHSIRNFDETELCTQEQREKYGIITYYKYGNEMRRRDNMILLTEFGVYRLIINSRKDDEFIKNFKKHIYSIIRESRLKEHTQLIVQVEKFAAYASRMLIFVKEINGDNPYNHMLKCDLDTGILAPSRNPKKKHKQRRYLIKYTIKSTDADIAAYGEPHIAVYGSCRQLLYNLQEKSDENSDDSADCDSAIYLSTSSSAIMHCLYVADNDIINLGIYDTPGIEYEIIRNIRDKL